ncbi:MAG: DUF975 family protein [Mogibacterium sp.]|nr:DUF975 family protein [Mogibacterium sp.]
MWNRILLKQRGKTAFQSNYWKCVLAALVLSLATGGVSFNLSYNNGFNLGKQLNNDNYYNDYIENYNDYEFFDDDAEDMLEGDWGIDEFKDLQRNPFSPGINGFDDTFWRIFLTTFIITFTIVMAVVLVIVILLLNPLEVGCRKFFLDNSEGRGHDVGTMLLGFNNNYKNIVRVQFFRTLYIMLWSLLFFIPGIIKTYEYRLVPYLLAENPNLNEKEALETSGRLMHGHKWKAFLLDFSFIGWHILAAFTIGILGLFYVNPYVFATQAELYRVLSGRISGTEDVDSREAARREELARLYGGTYNNSNNAGSNNGAGNDNNSADNNNNEEDVYITFEEPKDTSTFD